MKPYYEDTKSGIVIYHGDCHEILPKLGQFDLCLTDPPYGIGRDGGKISTSKHGGRKPHEFLGWDSDIPENGVFELIFLKSTDQIIWGGNYFAKHLPSKMGWLVWDKGQEICSSDCELAFSSRDGALRRIVLNRVELLIDGTSHPTQKPLKLMTWCIGFFKDAKTILDPFMGSGTTLRAAKDLGKQCTGIEREEKYCEIAALRLSQEVLAI